MRHRTLGVPYPPGPPIMQVRGPWNLARDQQTCDPDGGISETTYRPSQPKKCADVPFPAERIREAHDAPHQVGTDDGLHRCAEANTGGERHALEQRHPIGRFEGWRHIEQPRS